MSVEAFNPCLEPILSVRDGVGAVEFYQRAFGARVIYRVDGEQGEVVARLSLGSVNFWVADESPQHANFSPASLGGGTVRMLLIVDDPDSVFEQVVSEGAIVVWKMGVEHGWRAGQVVDPFGHHWEIGKPLPE